MMAWNPKVGKGAPESHKSMCGARTWTHISLIPKSLHSLASHPYQPAGMKSICLICVAANPEFSN